MREVKFSTKIIAFIMIVPIAGFIVFGKEFFSLWLPNESETQINLIQTLSILSLIPYVVSVSNYTLFVLDTTTNKLKRPVIATMITSILSTITTICLILYTNAGIYAVAGVSSFYWIIKVVFFNNINAAKNLRLKWNTFLNQFFKNCFCMGIIIIVLIFVKQFMSFNNWIEFFISSLLAGGLGYIITFLIIFNKDEKNSMFNIIKRSLNKRVNY